MSYSFVNSPAVRTDIIEAVDYYKKINPEYPKQFLFRIREAKAYIAHSPFGFQIKYKQVRTLLLKKFPYHIHYLVDETKEVIVIIAIIHAYKNPKDYSNR
jgi:plasmid stabilization system protein ParE